MGGPRVLGQHGVASHGEHKGRHCIGAACHWEGIVGWHAIRKAWGGMLVRQHGRACHWSGMGRHAIGAAWGSMLVGGMPLQQHGVAYQKSCIHKGKSPC